MRNKHQTPNTKHQISSKFQTPDNLKLPWSLVFGVWNFFSWFLVFGVWCFSSASAATNSSPISADQIPELLPPRVELPPTFWEQYGWWVLAGGVLAVALVSIGIWLLLRPRPLPPIPAEVQARHELEPLLQQPENGALLSRVSQVVRHYIAAAFSLPPEELTTTEFCRVITGAEQVGPELSQSVAEFLQECDRRKFAPSPPQPPLQAVPRAFKLIDIAEARRARLQETRNPKSEIRTQPAP